jgi:hypothetical protein
MNTDIARATPGVERGCGKRQQGGTYLECGLTSSGGSPLEHFLVDPPIPYKTDHAVGVDIVLGPDGLHHVVDHVGNSFYPWPTDVLEEGRLYGFSRRVPRNLDFSKLTPGSRILLVHARGLLSNAEVLHPHFDDDKLRRHCALYSKTRSPQHLHDQSTPCSRDSYAVAPATEVDAEVLRYTRRFTDTVSYTVYPPSPEAPEPEFASAIIASLPVSNISVIKAQNGSHLETLEKVKGMVEGINVEEQDA